eukprot:1648949-Ditylum_brightwellii.AAC.1
MKLWADEDTLHQPLGKWCKLGNDLYRTWSINMYSGHLQKKQHQSRSRLQMGQSHDKHSCNKDNALLPLMAQLATT